MDQLIHFYNTRMLYLGQAVDLILNEVFKVLETLNVRLSNQLERTSIIVFTMRRLSDLGRAALPDDLTNLVSFFYALHAFER